MLVKYSSAFFTEKVGSASELLLLSSTLLANFQKEVAHSLFIFLANIHPRLS